MDFRKNDHGAAPHDISINFTPPQSFIPNPTLFCFCKYSPGNKLLWVSKTKRFSTWELLPVYNCHLISFQHIDGADLLTANKKSIRSLMIQRTLNSLTGMSVWNLHLLLLFQLPHPHPQISQIAYELSIDWIVVESQLEANSSSPHIPNKSFAFY